MHEPETAQHAVEATSLATAPAFEANFCKSLSYNEQQHMKLGLPRT